MNPVLKWFLIVTGGLSAVFVLLVLFAKYYVIVNIPIISGDLDTDKLSNQIKLPGGFSMGVYAPEVPDARILRFTEHGDLLVANPSLDQVMILGRDANGDGKADGSRVLIDDLNGPNGLDFFDDWLYIAETDAIGRIKFDHLTGETRGDYHRIVRGLPSGGALAEDTAIWPR